MGYNKKKITVTYLITASSQDIKRIAEEIAFEQTVELPKVCIKDKRILDQIVGKVIFIGENAGNVKDRFTPLESLSRKAGFLTGFIVKIEYPEITSGFEITQFINLLYGNISFKPNIKIIDIDFSRDFLLSFKGPKFGIEGIRKLLGVFDRPLIATALKPMGLSAEEFAEMCYQFTLGGIDIIKDDHGLVDFPFSSFKERVTKCIRAIKKAEQKTGKRTLYFPNITGRFDDIMKNIEFALETDVGGFLVSPFLIGFDCVRYISESDLIGKPLMSHPSLSGIFFTNSKNGISAELVLGKIFRLIGIDCSVYPNFGGRFTFDRGTCLAIVNSLRDDFHHIKKSFPTPAGGINIENVAEIVSFYGNDVILLVGGSLYSKSDNLEDNARYFYKKVMSSKTQSQEVHPVRNSAPQSGISNGVKVWL